MNSHALFASLLAPMCLAFILGVVATRVKSDLKFPEELYTTLTIYLLVAIGMKGGYKLSISTFAEFWKPGLAAVVLGVAIPVWCYFLLRKVGKFDVVNAAALAAHFGSVSAVTFSEALAFHDTLRTAVTLPAGIQLDTPEAVPFLKAAGVAGGWYEGFMPSLLTIMEVPAILVAIIIARMNREQRSTPGDEAPFSEVLRELFAGKSTLLLLGFMAIGFVSGKKGWEQVSPFLDVPFRGVLTLFLLEAGLVTGRRIGDLKKVGPFLVAFGIVMPVLHALLGILLGKACGMSPGGATILGVLAASASYIAAPAACRVALPKASPTLYLTASLAITFPFNIVIGLPLYHYFAKLVYGG